MRRRAVLLLGVAVLAAAGIFSWQGAASEGRGLYMANCASCHGANLEGQPDWQTPNEDGRLPAPPHDASGHSWHHPDKVLFEITKYGTAAYIGGGYQSDMPGFSGLLDDNEITAVLDYIKSTWPRQQARYQQDMTAREGKTE